MRLVGYLKRKLKRIYLLTIEIVVSGRKYTYVLSRFHPVTGHEIPEGTRGIASTLFFDLGTINGWVVNATPRLSLPPEKTRYPLYRRLGGSQGRSGEVRKISAPPGFDPLTAQPVGSRYTDYATRPTCALH